MSDDRIFVGFLWSAAAAAVWGISIVLIYPEGQLPGVDVLAVLFVASIPAVPVLVGFLWVLGDIAFRIREAIHQ